LAPVVVRDDGCLLIRDSTACFSRWRNVVFVVLMSMLEASDKSAPFHTFAFKHVSNNNVSDQDHINRLWHDFVSLKFLFI